MGESRIGNILKATIKGEKYTEPSGSDIETLLIELKGLINAGAIVNSEVKIGMPEVKAVTGQKGYVILWHLGVMDVSGKKIAFTINSFSNDVSLSIARTGVLIYMLNDTKTAADVTSENMIIENKASLGLLSGGKADTRYSPSVSNGDYGFVLRPYVLMSDGSYVYGDMITTSYTEVATKYPNYLIPSLPVQAANGVSFTMRWNIDDAKTISEMGMIYVSGEYSRITLDTPDVVVIPVPALCNHGICTNTITDTGNGVSVVGYCIIDGVTYYTKTLTVYYDSMIHEA